MKWAFSYLTSFLRYIVSFAAVLMARTPPQLTSAEPRETFHSTKLTSDIEASRFKKPALWNINTIKMRYACIVGGRSYGVFWLASFVTITALWLALGTKGMEWLRRRLPCWRKIKEASFVKVRILLFCVVWCK